MMVKNDTERAQWWAKQREQFANPDGVVHTAGGKDYVRNLPKRCPQCDGIFYAYQIIGHEKQPYLQDSEPPLGQHLFGTRDTCGYPSCRDHEEEHQMRRVIEYDDAHRVHPAEQAPRPQLVRGKGKPTKLQPLRDIQ